MKSIKLTTGEFLFVEVPDDVSWYSLVKNDLLEQINKELKITSNEFLQYGKEENGFKQLYINPDNFYLPKGNWNIISTTKDITEEQAAKIVENNLHISNDGFPFFREYNEITWSVYPYESTLESLNSLLKNLELNPENNYLILKKI